MKVKVSYQSQTHLLLWHPPQTSSHQPIPLFCRVIVKLCIISVETTLTGLWNSGTWGLMHTRLKSINYFYSYVVADRIDPSITKCGHTANCNIPPTISRRWCGLTQQFCHSCITHSICIWISAARGGGTNKAKCMLIHPQASLKASFQLQRTGILRSHFFRLGITSISSYMCLSMCCASQTICAHSWL